MPALKASALLAILTGAVLAAFETLVNWGQWQWWPWWLVDYVAAALLVSGGLATLKRKAHGRRLLSAGWAFTVGMAWMSLAGNLADGADPARDARVAGFYIGLIGLMIAVSLTGLLAAIFAAEEG
jgi:hypothetical protein